MQLRGVFEHAAGLVHALADQLRSLFLALAGGFDDAGKVFELAVEHAVHALDEAAGHLVDEAHLLLGIDVHELLQALLDGRRRGGDDLLHAVGEAAVQVLRHGLDQRGLLLLVDGDLRHGVDREHAGVAAHGAIEVLQGVLGRAADKARDQREGDGADHADDGGHKGVAHAGDERDDGLLHGFGVGHVKPGKAGGQADERAQKAEGNHQPGNGLGKGDAARAVDGGIFIDIVLDIGGVVVHAVGKEEVV